MHNNAGSTNNFPSGRQIVIAALSSYRRGPVYLNIPFTVIDAGFLHHSLNKYSLLSRNIITKRGPLSSGSAIYEVFDANEYLLASIHLRAVTDQATEFRISIPDELISEIPNRTKLRRLYMLVKAVEYYILNILEDYVQARIVLDNPHTYVFNPRDDIFPENIPLTIDERKLSLHEAILLILDQRSIDYVNEHPDDQETTETISSAQSLASPSSIYSGRNRGGRPAYPEDIWLREQVYVHQREPDTLLYQEWLQRWSPFRRAKHKKLAFNHALKSKQK